MKEKSRDTCPQITPAMLVELTDEETTCSICCSKFSSDTGSTDGEIRKHLPVLSSSRSCDHWYVNFMPRLTVNRRKSNALPFY